MTFFIVASAIKVFVVFNLMLVGVALLTLLERRVCAWMQDRLGPNRVGPQGILQPAADGLKNFLKEETSPAMADKALFTLAPLVSFVPALLTFGVIPFASPLPTPWGVVPMVVADLPMGVQQQIRAARRAARLRADDLVRDRARDEHRRGTPARRQRDAVARDRPAAARARLVHRPPDAVVRDLLRERAGGDEPAALRLAGGGSRAHRRLPHRIQLDEVLDVLYRRILEHGDGIGADGEALLWRLGHSVHELGLDR